MSLMIPDEMTKKKANVVILKAETYDSESDSLIAKSKMKMTSSVEKVVALNRVIVLGNPDAELERRSVELVKQLETKVTYLEALL